MSSWTEALGFVLALAMVWCSIRELHWSWPLAILSSLLYFFVFKESLLYAEAGLQWVFVALALWGWWQWLRTGEDRAPVWVVQRLTARGWWLASAALAVLWPALAWLLTQYTDSDVAWWDALPTALSLIGQVLLGRKYIDNWLVWMAVNLLSVGLFAYKGLWLTCLLYGLFLGLCVMGWRAWQQRMAAA